MNTKIQKTAQVLAIFPFFAIASPSPAIIDTTLSDASFVPVVSLAMTPASVLSAYVPEDDQNDTPVVDTRAERIDAYFGRWDLPLTGYGDRMVEVADKYGLDWRLIPAIAMRESTGGKFACYNNPFGWGSCKIEFASFDEAIEVLAKNLAGQNPRTEMYYKNKTTEEKLHFYNGTVIRTYVQEVVRIMERIENQEIK